MPNFFSSAGISQVLDSPLTGSGSSTERNVLDVVGGAPGAGNVSNWLDKQVLQPGRNKKNDALAAVQSAQAQTQALGQSETGLAEEGFAAVNTATLSPGQQAQIDQFQTGEKAAAKGFMANLGLSDSTMSQSMLSNVDKNALIMSDQMLRANQQQFFTEAQTHMNNAIQLLGMSNTELNNLYSIADQAQQKATAATTSLLTTVATLVGTYYAGPAGGAAAGAAVNTVTGGSSLSQPSMIQPRPPQQTYNVTPTFE